MVRIYHRKNPTFFMAVYKPKMSEYHHVADVDTAELGEAFQLTNSVHDPWYRGPRVRFLGSPDHGMDGCRSTSVGDILEKDGYHYEVRPVGFARIDVWPKEEET